MVSQTQQKLLEPMDWLGVCPHLTCGSVGQLDWSYPGVVKFCCVWHHVTFMLQKWRVLWVGTSHIYVLWRLAYRDIDILWHCTLCVAMWHDCSFFDVHVLCSIAALCIFRVLKKVASNSDMETGDANQPTWTRTIPTPALFGFAYCCPSRNLLYNMCALYLRKFYTVHMGKFFSLCKVIHHISYWGL
jgi:hypothetical protein